MGPVGIELKPKVIILLRSIIGGRIIVGEYSIREWTQLRLSILLVETPATLVEGAIIMIVE